MAQGGKFGEVKGFALTETMVVICIVAILAGFAGLQYSFWMKRYNVEREIREMHADLMDARARALHSNRLHFVTFAGNRYTIYEDTSDGKDAVYTPDGDGSLQRTSTGDAVIVEKQTDSVIDPRLGFGAKTFYFNKNGLSSLNGSVRLISDVEADYDCIALFSTRINVGKYNGSTCKSI
ncbi:MAG TPA: GspH/FimT family pseudopilin [Thermodesulfovibrionales bacterium]|nr:GspH/FimT family pseudopilin [Thermodesulfovibrionales bacterium]